LRQRFETLDVLGRCQGYAAGELEGAIEKWDVSYAKEAFAFLAPPWLTLRLKMKNIGDMPGFLSIPVYR
jgi:hypothetical protein